MCTDIWRRQVDLCTGWLLWTPRKEIVAPYVPMRPVIQRWQTHTDICYYSFYSSGNFMFSVVSLFHLPRRLTVPSIPRARPPAASSLTITQKGSFRGISLICRFITLWRSCGVRILSLLWVTVRWPVPSPHITGPSVNQQISQHSLWFSRSWEHYGKKLNHTGLNLNGQYLSFIWQI